MTWEHLFADEREEMDYFLSQEFKEKPMLVLIEQLPQETLEQGAVILGYVLKGIYAIDVEMDIHLRKSHGRRKWGSPTHYHIDAPDGRQTIHYFRSSVTLENPLGRHVTPGRSKIFGISAYSDQEAVEKANRLLPKKYAQFLKTCYREETREEGKDFGHAWWQEGVSQ